MADSARWLAKDRLEPSQNYGARCDAETRLVVVVVDVVVVAVLVAVAVAVSSRPGRRSDHFSPSPCAVPVPTARGGGEA